MRHVSSGLVSLILLGCSVGAAAAQNVCVRTADGAVVCGPVAEAGAQGGDKPTLNPFDQPAQPMTPPPTPALPPAAAAKPAPNLAVRQGGERLARPAPLARPAQLAHRPPPPRELERHPVRRAAAEDLRRQTERNRMPPPRDYERPPTRRIARDDVHRRQAERDLPPPRRAERAPPPRYAEIDRRRYDRPPPRAERDFGRRYDVRLRELEREISALRAERAAGLRRGPSQSPLYRDRPPPPRYPDRDTRRDDRARIAASPRPPRRGDGYYDNN